jgi:uncharacterized protein YbjT (DUF2867 family)
MNILLCGASGFVGRNIRAALEANGHVVAGAGSCLNAHNQLAVDYAQDTSAGVWLPRLVGVDVVINAVGVLRDTRRRPIAAVHSETPKALFDAASRAFDLDGVRRRVIQISALGVDGNTTRYATTKRSADEHLLDLIQTKKLTGSILRPSIVFGRDGASSTMFAALSKLPVLVLPKPVLTARVQPIAVQDLARGVAVLVDASHIDKHYECVGETALPLAEFIANLREQQGRQPARVFALPEWMTRISVRLGDQIPIAPWCSETLALLAKDNVSNSAAFAQVLGYERLPLAQFWRDAWDI